VGQGRRAEHESGCRVLKSVFVVFLFSGAILLHAVPQQFVVSEDGNDHWPGSSRRPFRTLEAARDAARVTRTPAVIQVRPGNYRLTASFVLNARDADLVFRGEKRRKARISGGVHIPADRLRKVIDPELLARLPEAARSKVVSGNLADLASSEELGSMPDYWREPSGFAELTIDGKRLRFARWPNHGWATIPNVLSDRPPRFQYDGARPEQWDLEQGVWLHGYWFYEWIDETVRIKTVDPVAKTIELAVRPTYRGIGNSYKRGLRRFRAINVLSELDEPGEYWLDYESGQFVVWPRTRLTSRTRIEVSVLRAPLVQITGGQRIRFEGFVFEGGAGDGVVMEAGEDHVLADCEFRNLSGTAVRVGGSSNQVLSCDIHDVGQAGVELTGGDRVQLIKGENSAVNNDITRVGALQQCYQAGIIIKGCGQSAKYNRVHHLPHIGILFSGNDHSIEQNEVDHVCRDSGDAAAIYSANSPGYRGTIISGNAVHHVLLNVSCGTCGVYLDNGLCGNVVEDNLFYRACDATGEFSTFAAVYVHHGYQNVIRRNRFVACGRAVGAHLYDNRKWHTYMTGRLKVDKEGATGLPSAIWRRRYSDWPKPGAGLQEFLAWTYPDTCPPRLNPVENNLVEGGEHSFGRSLKLIDNVVRERGPDLETLRRGRLPKNLDCGLRKDEFRRHVSKTRWGTHRPLAHAGLNQVVFDKDGDGVQDICLDGTASHDNDGDLYSLIWQRDRKEICRGARPVVSLPVGEHTIVLRAMNEDGVWSTDQVRVAILPPEREGELLPTGQGTGSSFIALPDHYRTAVGKMLQVDAGHGLLANDAETGRRVRIRLVAGPEHGRLEMTRDGGFQYSPAPGWSGLDTCRYQLQAGRRNSNVAVVSIGTGYCEGFIWDRSEEWCDGTVPGAADGNPGCDAFGSPVWSYESVTDRGPRWYAEDPSQHVWDTEWCFQANNGCWVFADDEGPFYKGRVIFQTDNKRLPVIRWQNPTGRTLRVRIAGTVKVGWAITPKEGTDTTIVLAREDAGKVDELVRENAIGKPKESHLFTVDLTTTVGPTGQLLFSSRTEDRGKGWVTTHDDLQITMLAEAKTASP
jgi:hypothetical protein